MRKKSGFTIVEQAVTLVPEFENVVRKLEQQVTLRGQSKSTLNNYIRRIALFVINFGRLPEQIDPEEIKFADVEPQGPQPSEHLLELHEHALQRRPVRALAVLFDLLAGLLGGPVRARRRELHAHRLVRAGVGLAPEDEAVSPGLVPVAVPVHVRRAVHVVAAAVADLGGTAAGSEQYEERELAHLARHRGRKLSHLQPRGNRLGWMNENQVTVSRRAPVFR